GNMHALRIRQHPASGNLYCLITALRQGKEFPVPGGLWKSEDGGESWRDVTLSNPFLGPTDFTLHPRDEAIIYLSAATAPGNSQGGVWSTADGGKDWRQILTDKEMAQPLGKVAYDHVMTVTLDPDNPAILYAGSALNGLWYSANEGKQWRHYEELPHRAVQSINFNPNNAQEILVTTFGGGVWSGARISAPSVFPASN
ncbi:MAG: hypothetical protein OES84_03385, partial [Kiritimatiellaceae bacterium]|nr:hypothetical protein [Kiritimatiellaceae bacterium]